jgi:ribonuclease G
MLCSCEENGRRDLSIRLYSDSMVSMEKVYSLEREMERALSKRVNLRSGGDLVIESTEALHIIDVNSGRFQSGKQKEEALTAVNLEAAGECARQIRLRNLSGIIVIDFINLKNQKNSRRILEELRAAVLQDPVRTQVVDMTKLGLVELTRQKIEVPLKDAVSMA